MTGRAMGVIEQGSFLDNSTDRSLASNVVSPLWTQN